MRRVKRIEEKKNQRNQNTRWKNGKKTRASLSPNVINFVFLFVNYINMNANFAVLRFSNDSEMMNGCV